MLIRTKDWKIYVPEVWMNYYCLCLLKFTSTQRKNKIIKGIHPLEIPLINPSNNSYKIKKININNLQHGSMYVITKHKL